MLTALTGSSLVSLDRESFGKVDFDPEFFRGITTIDFIRSLSILPFDFPFVESSDDDVGRSGLLDLDLEWSLLLRLRCPSARFCRNRRATFSSRNGGALRSDSLK